MLNLRPKNRPKMPNSLAIFAVLMLLISAVANVETRQEGVSAGQQTTISAKAAESESINTSVKSKSRGLNLGLLLFRRG